LTDQTLFILGGRFGEEHVSDSWSRLDLYADLGGDLVDSAVSYADGRALHVLTDWIRSNPGQLKVTCKIGHPVNEKDYAYLSRSRLDDEVRKLTPLVELGSLDSILLHRDFLAAEIGKVNAFIQDTVETYPGVHVGVSNWGADRLDRLLSEVGSNVVTRCSYNLSIVYPRTFLWPGALEFRGSIRKVAEKYHLTNYGWASLARGYAVGALDVDGLPDPTVYDTEVNRITVARFAALASHLHLPLSTVVIRHLMAAVPGSRPIVGCRTQTEIEYAAAACSFPPIEMLMDPKSLKFLPEAVV